MTLQQIIEHVDFFDQQDLEKIGVTKLDREELLILIKHLNHEMILSLENWDGG